MAQRRVHGITALQHSIFAGKLFIGECFHRFAYQFSFKSPLE